MIWMTMPPESGVCTKKRPWAPVIVADLYAADQPHPSFFK
jgi:hypothetical protein